MILIAPDKYKGTLSAAEAAEIIKEALDRHDVIKAPMADGGEGTARILCRDLSWQPRDCYFVNPHTRTAVIDSSAVIGMSGIDPAHHDILRDTSYALGLKVREILKGGCKKVIIGIGGTRTCDGGMGFLDALDRDKLHLYRDALIGLSDVRVPLVAPIGQPSALMFARQKGATDIDIDVLHRRLTEIYREYPGWRSPFDGAGGGLGFAIASVIGAECRDGAKYVLDNYDISWQEISLIITGEGSIDTQTSQGKVVSVLHAKGDELGIPVIAFGGTVTPALESDTVISTTRFYPELPLDKNTAALRLSAAVKSVFS